MLIYFIQASQEARDQELHRRIEETANRISSCPSQECKDQIFSLIQNHPHEEIAPVIREWTLIPVTQRTNEFIAQIQSLTQNRPHEFIDMTIDAWKYVPIEQRTEKFIEQIKRLVESHPTSDVPSAIFALNKIPIKQRTDDFIGKIQQAMRNRYFVSLFSVIDRLMGISPK